MVFTEAAFAAAALADYLANNGCESPLAKFKFMLIGLGLGFLIGWGFCSWAYRTHLREHGLEALRQLRGNQLDQFGRYLNVAMEHIMREE